MNRRYMIIGIVIFLLLFIGMSVYFLIPKSYIVFQTAPEQVAILIDGKDRKNINNGDSITIAPGKHTVVVFRDEFNPYTTVIDVKNGETAEIVAALVALTDGARELLNNDKSNKVIEKSTGIKMEKQVELMTKANPIMEILPIERLNYLISSCPSELYPDNPNKIALCVDIQSDDYKDVVKAEIKTRGYDPESFEYIWNNYLNGVE